MQIMVTGVIDYGQLDRWVSQGHRDFDRNSRSRMQYGTPLLLAGGIGGNDVTCALVLDTLVPVVRV